MSVTDQKVARCVARYREKLDAHPRTPESLSQAPASRLHVIIELAGAKRRSEALLARLDQAFTDAEIVTYPRLTDPVLKRGDPRVFMFDRSRQIKGLTPTRQLFHDEKTLQSFILANLDEFDEFRELGLSDFRPQARLDSGRRVDLLCKRPALNQLVGIELKVREPDDRAVGQLEHYLDDLAEHARKRGCSAHFILIAGQPEKSVRDHVESYAATRGLTVTFLLYRVQMDPRAHP